MVTNTGLNIKKKKKLLCHKYFSTFDAVTHYVHHFANGGPLEQVIL